MRFDFRVRVDLSRIFQDSRRFCWVFVDSTKIFIVQDFERHIQELFRIECKFQIFSKGDDQLYLLPIEEDIRVLRNNDSVVIIPETQPQPNGKANSSNIAAESVPDCSNNNSLTNNTSTIVSTSNTLANGTHSQAAIKNSEDSLLDGTSGGTNSFYKTAVHDSTLDSTKHSDIFTEDTSISDNTETKKRKRTRKNNKNKKSKVIESDVSEVESENRKPKIINSVTLPSAKHIRFDNDAELDDTHVINHFTNTERELKNLIGLRQSSTPLTFERKKQRNKVKSEPIEEIENFLKYDNTSINSNCNNSQSIKVEDTETEKTNVIVLPWKESIPDCTKANESVKTGDTISFKVLKLNEEYTPQISSQIVGKIISYNADKQEYTLEIIYGQDQLEDPAGKFALPKDEDDVNTFEKKSKITTIETTKLIDLQKVVSFHTQK